MFVNYNNNNNNNYLRQTDRPIDPPTNKQTENEKATTQNMLT